MQINFVSVFQRRGEVADFRISVNATAPTARPNPRTRVSCAPQGAQQREPEVRESLHIKPVRRSSRYCYSSSSRRASSRSVGDGVKTRDAPSVEYPDTDRDAAASPSPQAQRLITGDVSISKWRITAAARIRARRRACNGYRGRFPGGVELARNPRSWPGGGSVGA